MNTAIIRQYQQDTERRTKKHDQWLARQEAREQRRRSGANASKHVSASRSNQALANEEKNILTESKIS